MSFFKHLSILCLVVILTCASAHATIFGRVQGIVHDPEHRPIQGAKVSLQAIPSGPHFTIQSNQDGYFTLPAVPFGTYQVTVKSAGFDVLRTPLTVSSESSSVMHFMLQIGSVNQSVRVTAQADVVNGDTVTPTTTIGRVDIAHTPGADRTNSVAMITDYVPGAYMVHDMLHIRGGHQVSWMIDGVEIPNTNIASNLGAQIDPKDIQSLEVQRGSYNADLGDRTYGVFDVVPRTGFDRNNQAELSTSFGSFDQTNDQINFGSHTEKFAYYGSLNGNRTNYGLQPPTPQGLHDAANGYGGFSSLLYNRTSKDQLRLVTQLRTDYFQIPYDPNPNSVENQAYNSSGLRDAQKEVDGLGAFTWAHTFSTSMLLQLSPFYHFNSANYHSDPHDIPVATTSDRTSNYGGLQASLSTEIARNTLEAGVYTFGQHDANTFGAVFNPPCIPNPQNPVCLTNFIMQNGAAGGLTEEYVSDNFKATDWLALIAGLRSSQFMSSFTEIENDPRFGIAVTIPKLDWVFRAFYGRYYQAPPLLTVSGALLQYADMSNTSFSPLHGERDEERQFGVQIPLRGWLIDADTFQNRANNFLDHSNIGESSIYFPVTIDGALIQAWELTIRSPRNWRYGQAHLAYSNQIAQQRGPITGGLICAPVGSPQCDAGFNYTPLDHDQRNTLNVGLDASLPRDIFGSANVYYGSGFTNGTPTPNTQYPGAYLPYDTSVNLSLGKTFRKRATFSITATNVTDHRVLLDNSLTFGGFHYNGPREVFGELRFRFHYGRLFTGRRDEPPVRQR